MKNVCLLVTLAVVAACGAEPAFDRADEADVVSVESAVWNGTSAPAGVLRFDATVRLAMVDFQFPGGVVGGGICSGTLLRNNVVLTAKHCTWRGVSNSAPMPVGNLYVYNRSQGGQFPPSCAAPNCARVSEVLQYPTEDVALMFLSSHLKVPSAQQYGHSIPIYRHAPEVYLGQVVNCSGYGSNALDAGGKHTGYGILRQGYQLFREISADRMRMVSEGASSPYQLMSDGDSGGPCWSLTLANAVPSVTLPQSVLGVHAANLPCQGAPCLATGVSAVGYRSWARMAISARRPAWDTDYIPPLSSSSAPYDGWIVQDPVTSPVECPSFWGAQQNTFYQSTNCRGTDPEGTILLHRAAVIDGALISTRVFSNDDDAAGIVFRFVDQTHYYLFQVSQARNRARLYKRTSVGFEVLDTATVSIDWADSPKLSVHVQDDLIVGMIEGLGNVVSAHDTEYPEGKVGIYTWALEDASFWDGLTISHFGPGSDQEWEPHWE